MPIIVLFYPIGLKTDAALSSRLFLAHAPFNPRREQWIVGLEWQMERLRPMLSVVGGLGAHWQCQDCFVSTRLAGAMECEQQVQ